ncbi:DNA-dependent metalloprotease dvc-1 [Planococcus citri]|uniref:DNA-dependent metalloprotease dvc-1 n=1 Tax=Planococcus citri TaxID=170843 RepID=UPI0031F9E2DA
MMTGFSSNDEMDKDLELALKLSLEDSQNHARNFRDIPGPSNSTRPNVPFGNLYDNRKRPIELNDRSPIPKKVVISKELEDYQLALKLSEEINGRAAIPVNDEDADFALALKLSNQNNPSTSSSVKNNEHESEDFFLAIKLSQEDFAPEIVIDDDPVIPDPAKPNSSKLSDPASQLNKKKYDDRRMTVVDPSWETIDPTPDIYALFAAFNERFFWGKLDCVEVKWSPRMTQCAGVCSYSPRAGFCSVRLSQPLLKLRPRKDLVETMLHEMIHAFLFVTRNDRDRDGHGPRFLEHMNRINNESGAHITVYHSFHEEVKHYKTHWWKCNGPCQHKAPYFGSVKRSTNRAPGPNDLWWNDHRATCGGEFIKVKEPENYVNKKQKKKDGKKAPANVLDNYFPRATTSGASTSSQNPLTPSTSFNKPPNSAGVTNSSNVVGFQNSVSPSTTSNATASSNNLNRGQKILSLVDVNAKKDAYGALIKSNKSPDRNKFVPMSGQKNVFRFINGSDW